MISPFDSTIQPLSNCGAGKNLGANTLDIDLLDESYPYFEYPKPFQLAVGWVDVSLLCYLHSLALENWQVLREVAEKPSLTGPCMMMQTPLNNYWMSFL